jgi:hypothetical protein
MANDSCTLDLHLDEKCIPITIGADRKNFQPISGSLALSPKLIASPAEKCDVPARQRARKGLLIHETQHQHLLAVLVLNNGRHQSLHLFEIDLYVHIPPQKKKNPLKLSRQRARDSMSA